ncbi:MAG TPA: glycosyltransferase [Armatimonadota bacterium]|nr:glycosyltransferase [Armatimonadota bacterium]
MGYPIVDLSYLRTMTDCAGVIQHAVHSVPNRRLGYTTDDNARALIVAAQHYKRTGERADLDLAITYLSYLHYAQSPDHKFRESMAFDRTFVDDERTEDCYGRAIWACGYAASSKLPENVRIVARKLFDDSIAWVGDLNSPRAKAYSMLGMADYLRGNRDRDGLGDKIDALANSLLVGLRTYGDKDWQWYEPYLTYGNAILPLAMLVATEVTGRKAYRDAAVRTIQFLTDNLILNDRLEIIGNDGWYMRGGKRAWYDQQSIDAGYAVCLYVRAYELLGAKEYLDLARIAHDWFFGNNRSGVWVYDPTTKGCCDAITPEGVNLNQGAESCICFVLAHMAMQGLSAGEGSTDS